MKENNDPVKGALSHCFLFTSTRRVAIDSPSSQEILPDQGDTITIAVTERLRRESERGRQRF